MTIANQPAIAGEIIDIPMPNAANPASTPSRCQSGILRWRTRAAVTRIMAVSTNVLAIMNGVIAWTYE
ncbi:unannotated protein [freshwater metagenome]|uniref:Unannotated protein n=1 Tax=freshwater metagenome TaxID=449393 RepID=A0A6J7DPE4_9ZZZZ